MKAVTKICTVCYHKVVLGGNTGMKCDIFKFSAEGNSQKTAFQIDQNGSFGAGLA